MKKTDQAIKYTERMLKYNGIKNIIMKNDTYMILLVDRLHAVMFTLTNGTVGEVRKVKKGYVPQKVKHGDDTWDAQNKIYRHIEDHLHRHLQNVAKQADAFAKANEITAVIIGTHKPLYSKIEKNLSKSLLKKVKGMFVTGLKASFNEILVKAEKVVYELEEVSRDEK